MYIQTISPFSCAYLAIHVLDRIALSYVIVAILYPAANAAIEEIMITAENVRTHRLIFISSWAQRNVCTWAIADSECVARHRLDAHDKGGRRSRHHPLRKNDELRGRGLNQIGPFLFIAVRHRVPPFAVSCDTLSACLLPEPWPPRALPPCARRFFYSAAIVAGWPSASAAKAERMPCTSATVASKPGPGASSAVSR